MQTSCDSNGPTEPSTNNVLVPNCFSVLNTVLVANCFSVKASATAKFPPNHPLHQASGRKLDRNDYTGGIHASDDIDVGGHKVQSTVVSPMMLMIPKP